MLVNSQKGWIPEASAKLRYYFFNHVFGLAEEWMKEKKENDVPFSDWFLSHSNYIPKDTDTSSLDKYQKDMEDVVKEVSDAIDQVFEFKIGTTDDEDE